MQRHHCSQHAQGRVGEQNGGARSGYGFSMQNTFNTNAAIVTGELSFMQNSKMKATCLLLPACRWRAPAQKVSCGRGTSQQVGRSGALESMGWIFFLTSEGPGGIYRAEVELCRCMCGSRLSRSVLSRSMTHRKIPSNDPRKSSPRARRGCRPSGPRREKWVTVVSLTR